MPLQNNVQGWYKIFIIAIQITNITLTLLFLVAFLFRYLKLRHAAITDKHIHIYPKIRIFLSVFYIVVSVAYMLIYSIAEQDYDVFDFFFEGGVGQCINSIILFIHLIVLRQQLTKQKTCTRLHMMYMIYLAIISVTRLVMCVISVVEQTSSTKKVTDQILLSLSSFLTLLSLFMLFFWLKKRKQLPEFIDHSKITQQGLANISNMLSAGHVSLSRTDSFEKRIYPTVMVQKGRIRVILETYTSNCFLNSDVLDEVTSKTGYRKNSQMLDKNRHLQIISNHLYSIEDIRALYVQCNRFNIHTKINFKNPKMGKLYQQLKQYLEQLFAIKKSYVPEILQLFYIQKQDITEIWSKMKKSCIHTTQLEICENIDSNAMFISVFIFKNFWVDDHFIFYLHIKSVDHKDSATIYKRYTDFQQFHRNLQKILLQNHMENYKLVSIPKKHFFGWDSSGMAAQRQKYLQNYCRYIANDFHLMNNVPAARDYILCFLNLNKIFAITPQIKIHKDFYYKLSIYKGNILQQLLKEEYITYYEFVIQRNGVYSHKIIRRFQEFVNLHETLEKWMSNIEICYKFLVLPDKILFKSQSYRHDKLLKYIEALVNIQQIYKVYAVTNFLNLAENTETSSLGLSIIKRASVDREIKDQSMNQSRLSSNGQRSSQRHGSRISQLIEQLIID